LQTVRRPFDVRKTVQLLPACRRRQVTADYLVHRAVLFPAPVTLVGCKTKPKYSFRKANRGRRKTCVSFQYNITGISKLFYLRARYKQIVGTRKKLLVG